MNSAMQRAATKLNRVAQSAFLRRFEGHPTDDPTTLTAYGAAAVQEVVHAEGLERYPPGDGERNEDYACIECYLTRERIPVYVIVTGETYVYEGNFCGINFDWYCGLLPPDRRAMG